MSDECPVSVVMAVYNSEEFVGDAVASILRERTPGMEVILVDDGSTDGSGAVCDRLAVEDSRVRVIHEKNAGMCHARNVGIRAARGEWVTFADNDDAALPGFVDGNLAVARKYDADVVRFGRRLVRVRADGEVARSTEDVPSEEMCLRGDELRTQLWLADYGTNGPWSGLYRRSMLLGNGVLFPESFHSGWEDAYFNDQVVRVADSYAFNPECLYEWRRRTSHSTSMKALSLNLVESVSQVLSFEWSLMDAYGALEANPSWCSHRLFAQVRGLIMLGAYTGSENAGVERRTLVQVRELLEPYLPFMGEHNPGGVDGLMLGLLIRKRYGLLRAVVHGGVAVKEHL